VSLYQTVKGGASTREPRGTTEFDRLTGGQGPDSIPHEMDLRERRTRAAEVLRRLAGTYPAARTALNYTNPLELVVGVLLSAQCTDARVNQVTEGLFGRFRSAADYRDAPAGELEGLIRPCGLWRNKAKALRKLGKELVERHAGEVPKTRRELAKLSGLGEKSAGVVAIHISDEPALPVDTHVARVAYRLGWTRSRDPSRIERNLQGLLPKATWTEAHHLLIHHGRNICRARRPRCSLCPVNDLCPKRGVKRPA